MSRVSYGSKRTSKKSDNPLGKDVMHGMSMTFGYVEARNWLTLNTV